MFDKLITIDQLLKSPWQEVVDGCEEQTCSYLHSDFSAKAKEVGPESEHASPLQLLSSVCSTHMRKKEDNGSPYGPLWVSDGKRTFLPEDLSAEQAEELFDFMEHVSTPDLKARIADTLWVSKKNKDKHLAAKIAVSEHIKSGYQLIHSEHPIRGIDRFERAVAIAAELGRGGKAEMDSALAACWSALNILSKSEIDACQYRLARCVFKYETDKLLDLGGLCYDLSLRRDSILFNFDLTRSYWELTSDIFAACGNNIVAADAKKRRAWNYIKEAAYAKSYIVKANVLAKAIEAHRRIGAPQRKIDLLHKWLLRAQSRLYTEMQSIDIGPIDLSDAAADSIRRVSGKSTADALIAFALIAQFSDPAKLREQAIAHAKKFVLSSLFGSMQVNASGKVVAKVPSVGLDQTEPEDDALLAQMHSSFDLSCRLQVLGVIEPARRQLIREHSLSPSELWPVVTNSPFIPQGREWIFAKGLAAGFSGDFLVATHLLVPQIENCLRHIIEQCGGLTSTIDSNGIQQERTINGLLDDELVEKTLGKHVLFSLKALLVEKTGANFRHGLCHGLFDSDVYTSYASAFIWWLTFRLCYTPWVKDWLEKRNHIRNILRILSQIHQNKLNEKSN